MENLPLALQSELLIKESLMVDKGTSTKTPYGK